MSESQLLSLLYSLSSSPCRAGLCLHETDGTVAATLRLWCESRNIKATVKEFQASGRRYRNVNADVAPGISVIVINDIGPVKASVDDGCGPVEWRPSDQGVSQ